MNERRRRRPDLLTVECETTRCCHRRTSYKKHVESLCQNSARAVTCLRITASRPITVMTVLIRRCNDSADIISLYLCVREIPRFPAQRQSYQGSVGYGSSSLGHCWFTKSSTSKQKSSALLSTDGKLGEDSDNPFDETPIPRRIF